MSALRGSGVAVVVLPALLAGVWRVLPSLEDLSFFSVDHSQQQLQRALNPRSVDDKGNAVDPHAFLKALRADPGQMAAVRAKRPDWAKIVDTDPLDVEAFQAMMRTNYRGSRLQTLLAPDGAAKDVTTFRDDPIVTSWAKEDLSGYPEAQRILEKGTDTELQQMLRAMKSGVMPPSAPLSPEPPAPETPYDLMGEVMGNIAVQTDAGEIKDLYVLQPKVTEDETARVPPHMVCDACKGIAHQSVVALSAAHAGGELCDTSQKGKLLSTHCETLAGLSLETLETLCYNKTLWENSYGISAGRKGINLLIGPGIPAKTESFEGDEDVLMQRQHMHDIGIRLLDMCSVTLLGGEFGDEDLIKAARAHGEDIDGAAKAVERLVCDGPGQPCGEPKAEQPAPKKKKQKKKRKASAQEA